ncbi:MAG: TIGR03435 family protein [Acidobacteriaceae bacterium]|nr:TIGR03435 family protein [Acidobacteriaceae bacterium]
MGRFPVKLNPPKDLTAQPWVGSNNGGGINGDGIVGANISMPLLSLRLSRFLGHPVLDETGINGAFDFKCEYAYDATDPDRDYVGSILTSVEGIGLKLKAAQGPIDTIAIDHVTKPSPN